VLFVASETGAQAPSVLALIVVVVVGATSNSKYQFGLVEPAIKPVAAAPVGVPLVETRVVEVLAKPTYPCPKVSDAAPNRATRVRSFFIGYMYVV
jgi:uncharacterized membrane protein